jgi:enoyl-CoA hydratase/carnithine racemase
MTLESICCNVKPSTCVVFISNNLPALLSGKSCKTMTSSYSEPDAVQATTTPTGITTITINRHHRRNAVDGPTAKKLYDAFINFENDPSQKVCVFYGANGNFCAGFDLHEVSKWDGDNSTYSGPIVDPNHRVDGRNLGPIGPSRLTIKKPVISAVAGYAVAGGLELSLLGDIRVAEEDAIFGVYCRRWGVPLIDGGTVRLQAIIGLGRALDMILTGRGVGAEEALAMGLANRVVPKGKALEEATKLAESLLRFPQDCMNIDRANCYYSAYDATSFEDGLRNEFETGRTVVSVESVQGATKFSKGAGRHGSFSL